MKPKRKLRYKIMTAVSAILLVLSIVATPIAGHYATVINWALGVVPYRTIKSDAVDDVVYFPSEFVKTDASGKTMLDASGNEVYDDVALVRAGQELCREVTAEGIALIMNDGLLPLSAGTKVGLFSQSTVNLLTSGTGSGSTASCRIGRSSIASRTVSGVTVTWFVPDEKKTGGSYQEAAGTVTKIDMMRKTLVFAPEDDPVPVTIPLAQIVALGGAAADPAAD